MLTRILCRWHADTEPSMVLYDSMAYCFVCHTSVPLRELNLPEGLQARQSKKDPTDVPKMLSYIQGLPKKNIRGFELPFDEKGYYLTWPGQNFYKRRNWAGKDRYTSPRGMQKPLYQLPNDSKANRLVIVEGEFNALTLDTVLFKEYKIVSPGPASDLLRYIKYYLQFDKIFIFVDYDGPGVVFGSQLRDALQKHGKRATLRAVKTDFNELYQTGGADAVLESFDKEMGNG